MLDNNMKKAFWFITLLSVLVIVPFLWKTFFILKVSLVKLSSDMLYLSFQ